MFCPLFTGGFLTCELWAVAKRKKKSLKELMHECNIMITSSSVISGDVYSKVNAARFLIVLAVL